MPRRGRPARRGATIRHARRPGQDALRPHDERPAATPREPRVARIRGPRPYPPPRPHGGRAARTRRRRPAPGVPGSGDAAAVVGSPGRTLQQRGAPSSWRNVTRSRPIWSIPCSTHLSRASPPPPDTSTVMSGSRPPRRERRPTPGRRALPAPVEMPARGLHRSRRWDRPNPQPPSTRSRRRGCHRSRHEADRPRRRGPRRARSPPRRDSAGTWRRWLPLAVARSPRSERSGDPPGASSSRNVTSSKPCVVWTRRPNELGGHPASHRRPNAHRRRPSGRCRHKLVEERPNSSTRPGWAARTAAIGAMS